MARVVKKRAGLILRNGNFTRWCNLRKVEGCWNTGFNKKKTHIELKTREIPLPISTILVNFKTMDNSETTCVPPRFRRRVCVSGNSLYCNRPEKGMILIYSNRFEQHSCLLFSRVYFYIRQNKTPRRLQPPLRFRYAVFQIPVFWLNVCTHL